MNPLPSACHAALAAEAVTPCVLVDGAMQQPLAARLVAAPAAALCLFDDLPHDAQALGPWLLPLPQAHAAGLTGSGPGVNWLASTLPLHACAAHLRHWMREGDPTGSAYTRLADGRVLRTAMAVWSPAQRAAFCEPLRGWWLADRDGNALALKLPEGVAADQAATPAWSVEQREALGAHSLVDQLLQTLKGRVRPAAALRSRERRHAVATQIQQWAAANGYADVPDQAAWIAWVLVTGECPVAPGEHPLHRLGLRGDGLWNGLMEDAGARDQSGSAGRSSADQAGTEDEIKPEQA